MALPQDKMRENEELFRLANERLRADSDTFAVVPGHAVDGEVVVRELGSFHVVRKEAA